ncbi:MAG: endonuclease [Bacteroidales bacterium]|nr:endonuclease [Bacteroidales bacterium]
MATKHNRLRTFLGALRNQMAPTECPRQKLRGLIRPPHPLQHSLKSTQLLRTVLLTTALCTSALLPAQHTAPLRIAFWNVENLFDAIDDSTTADDEFTPRGTRRWTTRRFEKKCNDVAKVLIAIGGDRLSATDQLLHAAPPAIVGLAEVENGVVLRRLCRATPLRAYGYRYIHYDSPDPRGIDVALLYRPALFTPLHARAIAVVDDSARRIHTRDILYTRGTTAAGDTLQLFVVHLPSKLGGAEGQRRRNIAAHLLYQSMMQAADSFPRAPIVAMGDFNSTPDEAPLRKALHLADCSRRDYSTRFVSLMACAEEHTGSYKYHGAWQYIDQFIVSSWLRQDISPIGLGAAHVYRGEACLTDDPRYMGQKPFRTYSGWHYQGGISDHLPIYVDLYHY